MTTHYKREQKYRLKEALSTQKEQQKEARERRGELDGGLSAVLVTLLQSYECWQDLRAAEAEAAAKSAEEMRELLSAVEDATAETSTPEKTSFSSSYYGVKTSRSRVMMLVMLGALACVCATGAEGAVLPDHSKPPPSSAKSKEVPSAPPAQVGFFKLGTNGVKEAALKPPHPALAKHFFSKVTHCQAITPSLLNRFYVSGTSPDEMNKATAAIMDVRNSDPLIASYIDTVFNYLPGFRIQLVSSAAEMQKLTGLSFEGGYDVKTRILYVSPQTTIDGYDKPLLRHEFRHALMHLVQIARTESLPVMTSECYFPPEDEKERAKVNALIEEGDKNVEQLHLLLQAEESGSLTQKGQAYLEQLRNISKKIYKKHYLIPAIIENTEKYLQSAKKNNGFIRIADCGPVRLFSRMVESGKAVLRWEMLDPLWGFVRAFNYQITVIKKNYPPGRYLSERDGYMFQYFPTPLIKALYPGYYQYTQELVMNTEFPEQVRLHSMSSHDFSYVHELDMEKLLTQADCFSVSRADEMIKAMNKYVTNGVKLDQCFLAAKTLLTKGIKVAEANLLLAEIAYARNDYSLAVKHYRVVLRPTSKVNLNVMQFLRYTESLFSVEQYSQVEKECQRVLKQPAHILGETKNKFEELLAKAKKMGQSVNKNIGAASMRRG